MLSSPAGADDWFAHTTNFQALRVPRRYIVGKEQVAALPDNTCHPLRIVPHFKETYQNDALF